MTKRGLPLIGTSNQRLNMSGRKAKICSIYYFPCIKENWFYAHGLGTLIPGASIVIQIFRWRMRPAVTYRHRLLEPIAGGLARLRRGESSYQFWSATRSNAAKSSCSSTRRLFCRASDCCWKVSLPITNAFHQDSESGEENCLKHG